MGFADSFYCDFVPTQNVTVCTGDKYQFGIVWNGIAYGDIYEDPKAPWIGKIYQGSRGAFVIEMANGGYAECTVVGDVATLCVAQ